jgi:hypothetical protein
MAHVHEMRDTDSHFVIDPITRTMTNASSPKSILVQYDHRSEIFTFEMPRYIEGHDMLLCNRVEVHFINIDAATRTETQSVCEIEDFDISEDEENTIVWSWTVSSDATQYVGPLTFAFRFACLNDTTVDYAWSTVPYSSISIAKSLYNGEAVIREYIDILEQWERKIGVGIEDIDQTVESLESNGINVIEMTLTDGRKESFRVRNGKTPERGVDYWTEEDKTEIINYILGILPVAEEASF